MYCIFFGWGVCQFIIIIDVIKKNVIIFPCVCLGSTTAFVIRDSLDPRQPAKGATRERNLRPRLCAGDVDASRRRRTPVRDDSGGRADASWRDVFHDASAWARSSGKIDVLLVDGFSNHDWKQTTKIVKMILDKSGLFDVKVSTAPLDSTDEKWSTWDPEFSKYDVVIQNTNNIFNKNRFFHLSNFSN